MSLRALIFDVDGTLAETEEAHRQAFNDTFTAHGLDWFWTIPEYTRLLETTGGKERMRRYRDMLGPNGPNDAEIANLHVAKTERYVEILAGSGLSLRPGVAQLISSAKNAGIDVAVATTTNRPNVDALTRCCWGCDVDEIFSVIAAGDEVAAKKPAPDVFELALSRLSLAPENCIAFEDSINGLKSAQSAQLRTVVTPSVYTAHQDLTGADWLCGSLAQDDLPGTLACMLHMPS